MILSTWSFSFILVLEGKFLTSVKQSSENLPGQAKKAICKGDLLFSEIRPNNKRFALVNFDVSNYVVSTKFMVIVTDDKIVDNKFFYHLIKSKVRLEELQMIAESRSGTFPQITFDAISNIEFSLPPLPEQTAIASILSALDDKIELNLQQNKTLEEMAMALYKHWFVDFSPFKDGKFIDSELGRIPEGWEVESIGEIVKIIGGFAIKSKDFSVEGEKVVKIKNISNNVVSIEGSDCIPSSVSVKMNKKFLINTGRYLIAMTGAEVGKVGVVPDYKQKLWLNQRVGMITEPKFEGADILIGNLLQSKEYYEIIQNLAYGSAQPNISTSGLEDIKIIMPGNKSDLNKFIDDMKNWDQMKVINYSEIQSLKSIRDSLLPKLISGEILVKDLKNNLKEVL